MQALHVIVQKVHFPILEIVRIVAKEEEEEEEEEGCP
jgi:hypothetical protein